jgi:excisionase family DNA binding protein
MRKSEGRSAAGAGVLPDRGQAALDLDDVLRELPPMLKVEEARAALRLSRSGLYGMLQDGTLAHVRLRGGGRGAIRIPKSSIEKYLRDCTCGD